MHPNESLDDSLVAFLVKGEGKSIPIYRDSVSGELVNDATTVFILPIPDRLDELFTTEIMSGLLFLFPELLLNDTLGSNTCMIDSRKPKGLITAHSLPS